MCDAAQHSKPALPALCLPQGARLSLQQALRELLTAAVPGLKRMLGGPDEQARLLLHLRQRLAQGGKWSAKWIFKCPLSYTVTAGRHVAAQILAAKPV